MTTSQAPRYHLPATERLLPLLAMALITAELLLLSWVAHRRGMPDWLFSLSVSCDIVLWTGGTIYFLARRAGGLAALGLTGRRLLRLTGVALFIGTLLLQATGMPLSHALLPLVLTVEVSTAVLLARALLQGAGRWRAGGEAFWQGLRLDLQTVLPPAVTEVLLSEVRIFRSAGLLLLRRPVPRQRDGFTALLTSNQGHFIIAVLFMTAAEMPALHLLLHALHVRAGWHLLLLALNCYGLLWLLGDRRLMQESAHRLLSDGLQIHLGDRCRGMIPYPLIEEAQVGAPPATDPMRPMRRDPLRRRVTPMDTPNVRLRLRQPVLLTSYFGIRVKAQKLDLYLDRPHEFVALLRDRRNTDSCDGPLWGIR